MSLNTQSKIIEIAKLISRDLRRNSTKAESVLWGELRNRKLNGKKFLRQHPIYYDIKGYETFYVADFYCHESRLVLELDGKYHQYKLIEDAERTEIINHLGIKVLRFKNDQVLNELKSVLIEIKKNLNC